MSTSVQLEKLEELLARPDEHECLEFKHAAKDFDFEKLGQYFSALSNEANLGGEECSWLVMGIDEKHAVVGSNYKPHPASLQKLKRDIAVHTALNFTFENIHTVRYPANNRRVLMLQIPPAPRGVPMSWRGHHYGRDHESTCALKQNEYDAIRAQESQDWSATICAAATSTDDLDPSAITKARAAFKSKHSELAAEIDGWSDATFLNKAKLTRGGRVTFAALLLVGRAESAHFLSPADPSVLWVRKRADESNADFQTFGPPLVLGVDTLLAKIRNDRFQFLRDGSLFPIDILQYDQWVIREMLHNCIAHQDYRQNRRINVIEREGALSFSNAGSFAPGSVEKVVELNQPQDHFRNLCLVESMRSINMIETLGSGIPRVYRLQRQRGFPMTDYDLSDSRTVSVKVHGQVLDENYTRALLARPDLEIRDVIALDKVQKGLKIDAAAFARLRGRRLVEGRRSSASVAAQVSGELDDAKIGEAVILLLRNGAARSAAIAEEIVPRLPNALGEAQKINKVRNTLQQLARNGRIRNIGKSGRGALWELL
jgi:ATP-dependent DNA helicase RecG